ncbi:MAG: hypothetical protein ABIS47_04365 [Acidimicrobiales bacterium]
MTDPVPPPYQPPPGTPGFAPPPAHPGSPPGPPAYGGQGPGPQPAAGTGGPGGLAGMTADASTLAATGLIAAVLFAVGAGLIGFLADPGLGGFRARLLALTNTVDVGDVALLGVAVALLLLTPDPPGGLARTLLLQVTAGLSAIIAVYAVIRSLVLISSEGSAPLLLSAFIATVGVGIAAGTVAFYAAKESFLKKEGRI